jgi:acetoin utilization deacetylase AcuC-like enzyme
VEQICLAHDAGYVQGVMNGHVANGFGNTLADVAAALPWTSGAMIAAARAAIANGSVGVAPVSGFHHACYNRGGGFCTFNGLMVTALALQADNSARRIGILDYDMHYGNGTDDILQRLCPQSISHYTAGKEFHSVGQAAKFLAGVSARIQSFSGCDVLLYQAGADPHIDDPLGGWLSSDQLSERDRLVFRTCKEIGLPVAWNLAGGYQTPLRRVLDIHDATMRVCIEIYLEPRTLDWLSEA